MLDIHWWIWPQLCATNTTDTMTYYKQGDRKHNLNQMKGMSPAIKWLDGQVSDPVMSSCHGSFTINGASQTGWPRCRRTQNQEAHALPKCTHPRTESTHNNEPTHANWKHMQSLIGQLMIKARSSLWTGYPWHVPLLGKLGCIQHARHGILCSLFIGLCWPGDFKLKF